MHPGRLCTPGGGGGGGNTFQLWRTLTLKVLLHRVAPAELKVTFYADRLSRRLTHTLHLTGGRSSTSAPNATNTLLTRCRCQARALIGEQP